MSNEYPIRGNTFPIKDSLRALGCKWNAANKCWMASTKEMADKAQALLGNLPAYNSPGPVDQGPVDDVVAECATHGRKAIGTQALPFRRPSEKDVALVGQTFWGRSADARNRYLIVRATKPTYFSRDFLEDMDMFNLSPGWYSNTMAVAVEATPEEIAADPEVAKAKAKALLENRSSVVSAVRKGENLIENPSLEGFVKCWGESRLAGHEALWVKDSTLVYEQSDYDMGPLAWLVTDAELAARALTLRA